MDKSRDYTLKVPFVTLGFKDMSRKIIEHKTTITLTEPAFLRLPQVLNVVPVSRSSWLRGIESGIYPRPIKLGGQRSVAWKSSDIRLLVEKLSGVAQ